MPSRKQRRRRAKDRRHEWEYVYVDDEGHEVEVEEPAEEAAAKPGKSSAKTSTKTAAKPGTRSRQPAGRPARKVDPPSWRRVLRRGVIFAPIMLVVVYLLKPKNATAASIIVQVAVLLIFFLPFSYFMDSFMYRNYRRRMGDPIPPRGRKGGAG